ncbi:MAG: sulfite exporter TauE/SafE family protein, partial [Myxococcales bacterium]|nr:sulfite exporter TauE/SafE family protein [Myxococcales bacterium]
MTLTLEHPGVVALLVVTGLVSGFINTVAGGGSLLTIPALLLLGMPADIANATNRVCVLAQSAFGAAGFDRGGRLDRGALARILGPTLLGGLAGSWTAANVPPDILKPVLIGMMALIAVTLVWKPAMLAPPEGSVPLGVFEKPAALPGLFAIGFYGGFAQAGVGLFLIAFLGGVLRYDLVRA